MFKKILDHFMKTGEMKSPPFSEPQKIQRVYMNPISEKRLEWLRQRQMVVEPVMNKLKIYVNSNAAGVSQTQIQTALLQLQSEHLINNIEIGVLQEHLSKSTSTVTKYAMAS